MEEKWLDIKGSDDGFKVSNKGRVKKNDKIKTLTKASNGYIVTGIKYNGIYKIKYVHRLVAETFLKNKERKPMINHKDCNKHNNNINNLEWVTQQENEDHATINGLVPNKLTKELVIYAKKQYKKGKTFKEIAESIGDIHRTTISRAIKGKTWAYLK
jgi:DNA-directed RNA polymerase specialized sigma54-like protein